jgi:hypothetical protein
MSGWFLIDWKSPERTLVGTLTDVHNAGDFPPGQDHDSNLIIIPNADEPNQALLKNRSGRSNDGGGVECEVNLIRNDQINGPDTFENWVSSLIGLEVTAKGVFVEDEGHNNKTELHPLDIIVAQVDGSILPSDWITKVAQQHGLQVGSGLFAYRFGAAADNRKSSVFLGTPLAQWTRPTGVTLALPPPPADGGFFAAAELQIGFALQATAEVSTKVDPSGAGVATLAVTCLGKNYDGPGFVIGEVVTYWSAGRQLALSAFELDFGTLGVGEASIRTLVVRNTGTQAVQVTVPSDAPSSSAFSWNAVGPVSLDIGQALDIQIDFSPLHTGTHHGVLTVTSDTPGSPQRVSLRGKCHGGTPQ